MWVRETRGGEPMRKTMPTQTSPHWRFRVSFTVCASASSRALLERVSEALRGGVELALEIERPKKSPFFALQGLVRDADVLARVTPRDAGVFASSLRLSFSHLRDVVAEGEEVRVFEEGVFADVVLAVLRRGDLEHRRNRLGAPRVDDVADGVRDALRDEQYRLVVIGARADVIDSSVSPPLPVRLFPYE